MLNKIREKLREFKAFIYGVVEFRSDFTTHFDGDLIESYDRGRDFAHRMTFRRYDH